MPLPATLIAGDSASWTDEPYVDAAGRRYDAAGYALTYELRLEGRPLGRRRSPHQAVQPVRGPGRPASGPGNTRADVCTTRPETRYERVF